LGQRARCTTVHDRPRPNLRLLCRPPIGWLATLHVAAKQLQRCTSRHMQLELQPASKLWPLCGVLETLSSTKSFRGSKAHRLLYLAWMRRLPEKVTRACHDSQLTLIVLGRRGTWTRCKPVLNPRDLAGSGGWTGLPIEDTQRECGPHMQNHVLDVKSSSQ
jgi:hypothetical protein